MSEKPSPHGMSCQLTERDPDVWLFTCRCKAKFTGATYELGEDKWREHVYRETGELWRPFGNRTMPRWHPDGVHVPDQEGQLALL